MKKVFKYGTGHEVPEGAEYLCTKVQEQPYSELEDGRIIEGIRYVWHYFLVEVKE